MTELEQNAIAQIPTQSENAYLQVGSSQLNVLNHRYELRQQLSLKPGRQTFLAWDSQQNCAVVVKVLLFGSDLQWCDFKLFEREAQILQALDHPSIPKYLDYFELDEASIQGFVLVQTYIAAPTLEQLMQQGRRFSEAELIELSDQLLQLLGYLHGQMPVVIHRDIKPSNILLAPKDSGENQQSKSTFGKVHLIDFGSVQASTSGTPGTITIVGSHGYIPLEQFGGQAVPASDLYSLGMTMLYLASGTHPSAMPLAKNGRVEMKLPQLSIRYRQWLDKMTHPYLEQRYDSAQSSRSGYALLMAHNTADSNSLNKQQFSQRLSVSYESDRLLIEFPQSDSMSTKLENFGCITMMFSFFLSPIFAVQLGLPGLPFGLLFYFFIFIAVYSFAKNTLTKKSDKFSKKSVLEIGEEYIFLFPNKKLFLERKKSEQAFEVASIC